MECGPTKKSARTPLDSLPPPNRPANNKFRQMLVLCSVLSDTYADNSIALATCFCLLATCMFSIFNCKNYSAPNAKKQRRVRDAQAQLQTQQMNDKSKTIWNKAAPPPAFEHPVSVALTGARGMVGTGVVSTLIQGGRCKHIVMLDVLTEADDFQAQAEAAFNDHGVRLHYVCADITNKHDMCDPTGLVQTTLKQANVQVMLHIAALVGPFFPTPAYLKVNYQGTLHVLDACKVANVGAVVDCSSPSTRFDGSNIRGLNEEEVWTSLNQSYQGLHEYARTKALGEQAVLQAATTTKLSTCAVAPHQVYGPSDRLFLPSLLRNAKKGRLRVMGYGNNCVSFTHESNIAHALLLAAGALVAHVEWKRKGSVDDGSALCVMGKAGAKVNGEYMVVTDATSEYPAGLAINFWDAIDDALVQTELGPIRSGAKGICRLPYYGLLLPIAYLGSVFTRITGRFVNITPFTIRMLVIDRYFDIGKASALLGYTPLVSFDDPRGWRASVEACYTYVAKEDGW